MLQLDTSSDAPLRILHVLRAPVGGLFRHVLDLAHEQIARGHHVGLIANSLTGGATAAQRLGALEPHLALGLMRLPIHRLPHPSDLSAIIAVNGRIAEVKPDVVHGHGSKGGAYARVSGLTSGKQSPIRVYTPHGGSLNYHAGSFAHRVFMVMERLLAARTDALLFESVFIAGRFETFVGKPSGVARTIPNGISPSELEPIAQKPDAADLLYVGEFRSAKGLDTFIEGLALLAQRGTKPKTLFVGDGPERALLEASARRAGVADQISFGAPRPAREAFSHGRLMVVPSRFELLPYIVLEAAGAQIPLIATNVGGMSEIFGPYADRLIVADDPAVLADAIAKALAETPEERVQKARILANYVGSRFSISGMVDQILQGYRDAIAARARA